jgi:Domain of unknown function (DUF4232)
MSPAVPAARRTVAGSALACLAVLATGCASGRPAATPTKTVTVTASPAAPASASPAAPSASTGAGTASPAPAGAAAACPTRSLSVKAGAAQGAAGSVFQTLDFTNISRVTCTLYGYPGVSLAGGKPVSQLGPAASESHQAPRRLVTLAPGAAASAVLRIVQAANFPPAKCHLVRADYLQIYPPNQTTPVYLPYKAQACAKPVQILTIGVVQPGAGGQ